MNSVETRRVIEAATRMLARDIYIYIYLYTPLVRDSTREGGGELEFTELEKVSPSYRL